MIEQKQHNKNKYIHTCVLAWRSQDIDLGFTKFECPQLWQIPGSTKLVEDVVVSLFSCLFMCHKTKRISITELDHQVMRYDIHCMIKQSPEKQLWISPTSRSSCLPQLCPLFDQILSQCTSQNGCCCRFWLFLHYQLPVRVKMIRLINSLLLLYQKCHESSFSTSMMGLDAKTFSSTLVCWAAPPTTAK